ncbi:MAG: endonuclease III [Desulfococcaceae bacterium]
MKNRKQAKEICRILKTHYPDVKTQLLHRNAFELLIATILSAQCTDRQVNSVTPALFRAFPAPESLAGASLEEIEDLIRPTGFFHNKAKHIRNCAKALLEKFRGEVPQSLEELITLPGVGRKTANVVRSAAFGQAAVVVDTHVKRISRRLGLTENTDPEKIESDLMKLVPEENWNDFGLHLIYFGREICTARKPACPDCCLRKLCEYPHI